MNITIQQMLTLDAVVSQGSIQAGAKQLNKTHPSVISVLKNLEAELGFALFDRSGYRSVLTNQGKAFHQSIQRILGEMDALGNQVTHLRGSEESELNIVIGDITPLPEALGVLRTFSQEYPLTRLNLFFGNLFGPNELLLDGEMDLMIHHLDKADSRYEYRDFCNVDVVPVVAPGFLKVPIKPSLSYADLAGYTQCIIRDTSVHSEKLNRFVLDNVPHLTVGDQYTKKEVIMQGMAWGHMPLFIVDDAIKCAKLVSIAGKHIKGVTREIVIARQSTSVKGLMAERLWQSF
ncbi:MAG TPA: LysR family transcriptional regulator [Thiobacillus sp.]